MLERAGEERVEPPRLPLELGPVVAEADDHGAGVEAAQRLEQHLHALVLDQLAEVDDGRRGRPPGRRASRFALPSSASRSSALPGFGASSRDSREQPSSAWASRGAGRHSSTSTPGGISCTPSTTPHTSRTTLRMCAGADDRRRRAANTSAPHCRQLRVAAHRVLELGSVGLDDVAAAARGADGAADQHVVDEHETAGAGSARIAAAFASTQRVELVARAVLHPLDVVPLVAIDHEDGQQTADVGAHGRRAPEVEALGVRAPGRTRSRRAPPAPTRARAGARRCSTPVPPRR